MWRALCALAAVGALAGWLLPAAWLDWQPALAWRQPWRWWSAAFVHWSALHLGANLAGCAVLAALGTAARLPPRAALAWLAAWPLTHLALLAQPTLAHYGGLSGVLHAGVAVVAIELLARRGAQGAVGLALCLGLLLKLALERPWAGPLAHPAGWDIALAPAAHLAGAVAGALAGVACSLMLRGAARRHRSGAATDGPTMPPR